MLLCLNSSGGFLTVESDMSLGEGEMAEPLPGGNGGLSVGIEEMIFPLVSTIQVRLVVKMKGRNEKKTVSHEKPYNLQVLGSWERGCVQDSVKVMQVTPKVVC